MAGKQIKYTGDNAAQGTKVSGYEEHGPYHCEDCIHSKDHPGLCDHPAVMADPELADRRNEEGLVQINPERGCCEYVNQPLDDDDDDKDQDNPKSERINKAINLFNDNDEE